MVEHANSRRFIETSVQGLALSRVALSSTDGVAGGEGRIAGAEERSGGGRGGGERSSRSVPTWSSRPSSFQRLRSLRSTNTSSPLVESTSRAAPLPPVKQPPHRQVRPTYTPSTSPPTPPYSSNDLPLSSSPTLPHIASSSRGDREMTDPPSSSPSSGERETKRVRAQTLPTDILIDIFSYAIEVPLAQRPHGGYLESWQSNESMARLTLVCKGWEEAATHVLYHSVALFERASTAAFVRTLSAAPLLRNKVNFLVISLSEDVLRDHSRTSQRVENSSALLSALALCISTVTHLQIHPLDTQVRPQLFALLKAASSLQVIVCSPRFYDPAEVVHEDNPHFPGTHGDDGDFFSRSDLSELARPAPLHTLDLDFGSSWSAEVLPFHNGWHGRGLKKLRLRSATDEAVLWDVLGQCSQLEVCELYFEQLLLRDETTAALQSSTASMKHILFLCNPTLDDLAHFDSTAEPIFDRLLPHYHRLVTLSVSATEVSSRVIRLIPPSLEALVVQAFNHVSTFVFSLPLIEDIRNVSYAQGLRSLRVHDAAEAWEEEHVALLKEASEGRGWDFAFIVDESASSSQ